MIKARIASFILLALLTAPVFAARFFRRGRKAVPAREPPWPGWLWHGAAWICAAAPFRKWTRKRQSKVAVWAEALHPGSKGDLYAARHDICKAAAGYTVLWLTAAGVFAWLMVYQPPRMPEEGLERAPAEGASASADVSAEIDGETLPMHLTVRARGYTAGELEEKMALARDYLKETLPGQNEDLLHVAQALQFESSIPDLPFTVEWQPENYQLISQDGTLGDLSGEQMPVMTSVRAMIRYRDITETQDFTVRITGCLQSEQDSLRDQLTAAVEKTDADSADQPYMKLPDVVDGKQVTWAYAKDHSAVWFLLTGVVLAGLMVRLQDEKISRQVRLRSEAVKYDYPGFVHQLVLLLGAGMTVRRSWDLIIEDQEKNGRRAEEGSWLHNEMLYARRQMQSGIPEIQVYKNFSDRMPCQEYAGICRLLVQLIKTGSKGMHKMMLEEARDAEKHRRDLARRLGETAGTKLLLPMMMLLSVVFAVIMLPAFLSL